MAATFPILSFSEILARASHVADCCADHASAIDYDGAFPADEFGWLREAGLLTAPLHPDLGGAGMGVLPNTTPDLLRLLRQIGRGNLAVGRIYEGHVNALLLFQKFGTATQKDRWAEDAHQCRLFSVWNTQAGDGVRLVSLPNGQVQLQGAKTFASGAEHIARPLITGADENHGWQMVIVPTERIQPAVSDPSFWHPLGMRSTASVHMDFSNLEVGSEDLVGKPGDYYTQPAFGGGGIRFMAVQMGGAVSLLENTRKYLRDQNRTQDPFQRERVGKMASLIESGDLWLRSAGELTDNPSADANTVVQYAHMARAAIEEICVETMRLTEKCVGARGLLRPHPVERIHRDLTLYLRQPGSDTALVEAGRYVLESSNPTHALWTNSAH
ncbi:MAG: acyl-CoA dehydrogenase family protein [Janthinobacterium lividum]